VLREVDRVLRADGHLIVLSFAPGGLWGLRHLLSSGGYPNGRDQVIREGRLRDWLELLSFDVPAATRYCHTLPIERFKQLKILPPEEWAQRWLPIFSGGYMLRVVGGIVEPTTRAPVRALSHPAGEQHEP
jgi:SAM-dependent methyltransferase